MKWKKRFQAKEKIVDRSRSGRPLVIPSEVTQRLIAVYCQHNPLPGCRRWTISLLENYLKRNSDLLKCSISRASIHRRLTSHALRPDRMRYFLQICDPHFFEKMEKIIEVYARSYEYLFCMDECTGLQALERIAPSLPAEDGKAAYQEFEYMRHGTVSIISFLHVSKGTVYTECIPDHTSSTVTQKVINHANHYQSSAQLHYICDNYSSHSTQEFCQGIAQLCGVSMPKLKTVTERRQWLQKDDKRIVFHFLPSHGSWLNMIEIWFGILQSKAMKGVSFSSVSELQKTLLSFTFETWNPYLAHPFNWTYKGDGLHEKVIHRVMKWLSNESAQLNKKFLLKQLLLLTNIATKYWAKVPMRDWVKLKDLLIEKENYIMDIIGTDDDVEFQYNTLFNKIYTDIMLF